MKKKLLLLLSLAYFTVLLSQNDSIIRKPLFFIKLESSIGVYVNDGAYLNWQAGLSAFHFANANQRYGFTVNYINIDNSRLEYIATGIVIEMNMFKYMYARLGTIGYLSLTDSKGHLFGITSNIGVEFPFNFFVLGFGYKSDALITENLPSNNNFFIQTSFRIDKKVKRNSSTSPAGL
jgi:hypothetical protein